MNFPKLFEFEVNNFALKSNAQHIAFKVAVSAKNIFVAQKPKNLIILYRK